MTDATDALEYVGFWPRVGATIIDSIVIMLATIPLTFLFYGSAYWADPRFVKGPMDIAINWILPLIAWVWLWRTWQASPGKMMIGARVVDATTGQTLSIGQCLIRYFAYIPATMALALGLIWVAFDPRRQGWHDKLARSVVVRAKDRSPSSVQFKSDAPSRQPPSL
jgi:uncharacterized RDD family membrane protein YckC